MRSAARVVLALFLLSCTEPPSAPTGDHGASLELVSESERLHSSIVNVAVRGTFQVFGGTPPRVLGLSGEEPARFPGRGTSGPGTCIDGKWYNPRGHATSGSPAQPHPHCWDPGADGMTIVLEPIAGQLTGPEAGGPTQLLLGERDDPKMPESIFARWMPKSIKCIEPCDAMQGAGTVYAYAVDAATNTRVGTLKFWLGELSTTTIPENLFECTVGGEPGQDGCLDYIFGANYDPLPPDKGGVGEPQHVTGFLYWHLVP